APDGPRRPTTPPGRPGQHWSPSQHRPTSSLSKPTAHPNPPNPARAARNRGRPHRQQCTQPAAPPENRSTPPRWYAPTWRRHARRYPDSDPCRTADRPAWPEPNQITPNRTVQARTLPPTRPTTAPMRRPPNYTAFPVPTRES